MSKEVATTIHPTEHVVDRFDHLPQIGRLFVTLWQFERSFVVGGGPNDAYRRTHIGHLPDDVVEVILTFVCDRITALFYPVHPSGGSNTTGLILPLAIVEHVYGAAATASASIAVAAPQRIRQKFTKPLRWACVDPEAPLAGRVGLTLQLGGTRATKVKWSLRSDVHLLPAAEHNMARDYVFCEASFESIPITIQACFNVALNMVDVLQIDGHRQTLTFATAACQDIPANRAEITGLISPICRSNHNARTCGGDLCLAITYCVSSCAGCPAHQKLYPDNFPFRFRLPCACGKCTTCGLPNERGGCVLECPVCPMAAEKRATPSDYEASPFCPHPGHCDWSECAKAGVCVASCPLCPYHRIADCRCGEASHPSCRWKGCRDAKSTNGQCIRGCPVCPFVSLSTCRGRANDPHVPASQHCTDEACEGREYCTQGCKSCRTSFFNPHCKGDHAVRNGCNDLRCRGLAFCTAACVGCPGYIAHKKEQQEQQKKPQS